MSYTEYETPSASPRKSRRGQPSSPVRLIILIVCAVIALTLLISSVSVVTEGNTGMKYRMGQLVATDTGTGAQIHAPFIEKIESFNIQVREYTFSETAYTKDTQVIEDFSAKVTYSFDRSQLDYIVKNIGEDSVEARIIAPNVSSIVKNMAGQWKGEELIQNRSVMEADIREELRDTLLEYGVILTDFNIVNIDFKDEFEEAIAAKVNAEVQAATTKNQTAILEEEANQKIIAAQADADAAKIQADAEAYAIKVVQEQLDNSPEYVNLQMIQTWNGVLPSVMGNTVNPFVSLESANPGE